MDNKNYILTDKFTKFKAHPFHLVDNSPWPFLASFGLLFMACGGVLYMHSYLYGGYFLTASFIFVVFTASFWWRDIGREGVFQGHHTTAVQTGIRYGMILFILTEVIFFIGFFWAFFANAISPSVFIGAIWPPVGLQLFNPLEVPLLNTVILLTSGITITWAHYAMYIPSKDYTKQAKLALLLTILLGAIFSVFQGIEYLEAPFSINSGIYGSIFYMLTGFHGAHVIIGTIFLIVNYIRMNKHHFTYKDHLGFELAIWYWHFVDVVWIFVYLFIYSHLFLYPDYGSIIGLV